MLRTVLLASLLLHTTIELKTPSSPGFQAQTSTPVATDVGSLEQGKPIERELSGGQAHRYHMKLDAGKFVHVIVDQKGIDVVVAVLDPVGRKMAEVDSPNGTEGPEPVSIVTESTGDYVLEVRSLEPKADKGRYEARIQELRDERPKDKTRVAAEQVLAEGILLSFGDTASKRKAAERIREAVRLSRIAGLSDLEGSALYNGGVIYDSLFDKRTAVGFYEEGLSILEGSGDQNAFVESLHNLGADYDALGNPEKALVFYNRAILLERKLGDKRREAITLSGIGLVYMYRGDSRRALDYFNESLFLRREVRDRSGEGTVLINIALAYYGSGDRQKALDYLNQAVPIKQAVADRAGLAGALNTMGVIYESMDEHRKAMEFYNQALALVRETGDRDGEANILSGIGSAYSSLGDVREGLEYYNRALVITRATGNRRQEADTLGNIGAAYNSLGELRKALDSFNECLSLLRALGSRQKEAERLGSIADVYLFLGEMQNALDYCNKALELSRSLGDRLGVAGALMRLGHFYWQVGDRRKALENYNQVLTITQETGSRGYEASVTQAIGQFYSSIDDHSKALVFYDKALLIARAIGDRHTEAICLHTMGTSYLRMGDLKKAFEHYNQAAAIEREIGDRATLAGTLKGTAWAYDSAGEEKRALECLSEALELSRSTAQLGTEADILLSMARVHEHLGDLPEALDDLKRALDRIETIRASVIRHDLRSSYVGSSRETYGEFIKVLMAMDRLHRNQGYAGTALEASEMRKARSLLDMLSEARADLGQGADPQLVERGRSLQQLIDSKSELQARLASAKQTDQQATELKKEIDQLLTQYQDIEAKIRSTSPKYGALTRTEPISIEDIERQLLEPNTVLLEFSLGEDQSFVWAVTPDSVSAGELPKRSEIEGMVNKVYNLLTIRNRNTAQPAIRGAERQFYEEAGHLSQLLLGPVAAHLKGKRLLIVADGALCYLPFAALPDPTTIPAGGSRASSAGLVPLGAGHEIVNLPSASALLAVRQQASVSTWPHTLAVFADPVFDKDDDRVRNARSPLNHKVAAGAENTLEPAPDYFSPEAKLAQAVRDAGARTANGSLPRLPLTRQEAQSITDVVGKERSTLALDFDASRDAVTGIGGQYQVVHFATHGLLDVEHPELSGLVLSLVDKAGKPQNGFLRLIDIYNLRLDADMVVLSGCQTALGKNVFGEGLVGLTRGFMYAGARRVLASLWSVDDEATSELMRRFYEAMFKGGMKPAAALREAQMAMRNQDRWKSPYYWAGFTIQGEWK